MSTASPSRSPPPDRGGHERGALLHALARLFHLLAGGGGQAGEQLVGGLHVLLEAVGIGAAAGPVDLGALDLLEDRRNAGLVLLDLGERLVDALDERGIAGLRLPHVGQALAQGGERLAPAVAQGRHLDRVVEVDDDVLLGPAQVS